MNVGYAALPKLPVVVDPSQPITESPRESPQMQSSPLPGEPDEQSEIAAFENHFRDLQANSKVPRSIEQALQDPLPVDPRRPRPISSSSAASSSSSSSSSSARSSSSSEVRPAEQTDLQRWHANLEARLLPFWSTAISSRTVRLSLYTRYPSPGATDPTNASRSHVVPAKDVYLDDPTLPIVTQNVLTSTDGAFQLQIVISWETLCLHPGSVHIAFGDRNAEVELFMLAELMPPPTPATSATSSPANGPPQSYFPIPTTTSTIPVTLSHARLRLISDIDDTVKLSEVLSGVRAVFHNVFVKDLKENVIDGMGDWYTSMWERGVRFHYVVRIFSAL